MNNSSNENPYAPPSSNPMKIVHQKGKPVKAVLLSTFIDIAGSFLLSFVLSFIYFAILFGQGMTSEEIVHFIQNLGPFSSFMLLGYLFGGLITVYCGYLCAKISRSHNYKVVTIYLILTLFIASLFSLGKELGFLERLIPTLFTLVCGYFGANQYIRKTN